MDKNMPEKFDRSVMDESKLAAGNMAGDLAMSYFGEFTEVPFTGNKTAMAAETRRLLDAGTSVIAEASFSYDGNFCMADILRKVEGGYELVEVKASAASEDDGPKLVKPIYLDDMAFQYYVLTNCGLDIKKVSIMQLNRGYIRQFLNGLSYPLYHLDFETFQQPVPLWDGLKPYQQLPFQYSLHIQDRPRAEPVHKEFLGKEGEDPRRELAERLCADIPRDVCVLAYNAAFEKTQIRGLAELFPDLSEHLMRIHENMMDLAEPFAKYDYNNTPYSTFDAVSKAVIRESETEYKGIDFKNRTLYIYKRWLDVEGKYLAAEGQHLAVQVTPDGEIVGDWGGAVYVLEESDDELIVLFDYISIYVPVPFRKGDILTYWDNSPFVLTSDEWKYGHKKSPDEQLYLAEGGIMDSICSYDMRENGHIHWDFNPATLDLEYYRGELTGLNRVLKAISSHMKGEIPAELMMNAYDIILHEEQLFQVQGSAYPEYARNHAGEQTALLHNRSSG